MSAVLTAEQALKLVGEMFVYHMPFCLLYTSPSPRDTR